MSFTSYLSPRAIWDRLVGRRTTDSDIEERFEARFRDTPLLRRLSRTADTADSGTSSESSDTILSTRVEGPQGPPTARRDVLLPTSMIASTPAVDPSQGTVVSVAEIERPGAARGVTFEESAYSETIAAGGREGQRTARRPSPPRVARASRGESPPRPERVELLEERRPAAGGGAWGTPIPRVRDDHATRAGAVEPGSSMEVRDPPDTRQADPRGRNHAPRGQGEEIPVDGWMAGPRPLPGPWPGHGPTPRSSERSRREAAGTDEYLRREDERNTHEGRPGAEILYSRTGEASQHSGAREALQYSGATPSAYDRNQRMRRPTQNDYGIAPLDEHSGGPVGPGRVDWRGEEGRQANPRGRRLNNGFSPTEQRRVDSGSYPTR